MATPGERKALLFLAGIAALGGIVRVVGWRADAGRFPAEDLAALDRQLSAAESVSRAEKADKPAGKGTRKRKARSTERAPPRASIEAPSSTSSPPVSIPGSERPLDLDRATAIEIEALPGVGPRLAERIVAWRDSAGGLGGLDVLDCVPGVGPSLLRRLAPSVTFSASRRPPCVLPKARSATRRFRAP
jgi:competence protein ComEA